MRKYHPYLSAQRLSSWQKALSKAYESTTKGKWDTAKHWFLKAKETQDICGVALGEAGIYACEAVLELGESAPIEEQLKTYRTAQKEKESSIPPGCLI